MAVLVQNNSTTFGGQENRIEMRNSNRSHNLRLNLWDNEVDTINGINRSAKAASVKICMDSIGYVFAADTLKGMAIGLVFSFAKHISGVQVEVQKFVERFTLDSIWILEYCRE